MGTSLQLPEQADDGTFAMFLPMSERCPNKLIAHSQQKVDTPRLFRRDLPLAGHWTILTGPSACIEYSCRCLSVVRARLILLRRVLETEALPT